VVDWDECPPWPIEWDTWCTRRIDGGRHVKIYLTDRQVLRSLCIGGRFNLVAFDPFQSTENAHELNQSHRPGGAGSSGGYRNGCFGTLFSVVVRSLIGRIAESRTFRHVSDSAYLTLFPGAAAAAASRRTKRRVDIA
jgi:hypothetical protein